MHYWCFYVGPWDLEESDVHGELNIARHLWSLNSLQLLIDTQVSWGLETWAWFIDTFMIGGEQTSDHCLKWISLFSPLFTYKHNKTLKYQRSYSFDLQATLVWSFSWYLRAISLCVLQSRSLRETLYMKTVCHSHLSLQRTPAAIVRGKSNFACSTGESQESSSVIFKRNFFLKINTNINLKMRRKKQELMCL